MPNNSGALGLEEGLRPFIDNIAQMLSGTILRNAENEKRRLALEERRQYDKENYLWKQSLKSQADLDKLNRKADALSNYTKGGETTLNKTPDTLDAEKKPGLNLKVNNPYLPSKIPEAKTEFTPYGTEDLIKQGLLGGVTGTQILKKLNPQPNIVNVKHHPWGSVGYDKTSNKFVDVGEKYPNNDNPNYKPSYKVRAINPQGTMDKATGKLKISFGQFDDESGKWLLDENNNKIITNNKFIAISEADKNGTNVYSKDIKKLLSGYFDNLLNLKSSYEKVKKTGGYAMDENGNIMTQTVQRYDKDGNPTEKESNVPLTADDLQKQVDTYSEQYSNFVKNISSEKFKNWYNQLYKAEDKASGKVKNSNPAPEDYWNALKTSYKKNEIDDIDFQNGVQLFQSTYMFNPFLEYGN